MDHLKSIYFYFLILLQLSVAPLDGQVLPLQAFSLAANSYVSTNMDGLQMDWRLDLGLTSMLLDQSNSFRLTTGFLQPSVNRFTKDALEGKYHPSIELRTSFRGDAMILFSKEPDLILFGYSIYNLHGQVIISDLTKYRSSYAGKNVDMNGLSSGVYIMQVFYLPESMMFDGNNNYSIKTIKFIKL
jgi:hypothetical protein